MARIPNGILGEFIGTAGNVSGYMRYGTNYLRSKRRKSTKPMTPARLAQQQKIKVCNYFTKPFAGTGFFNKTFPSYGDTGSGYNRATSSLLHHSIVGSFPDIALDYSLILVAMGHLPAAVNAAASVNTQGNIEFTWINNAGIGMAKETDKVVLVAYFTGTPTPQVIYSMNTATRKDELAILDVQKMQGYKAETWISFLNDDESDSSNSVYTGQLLL